MANVNKYYKDNLNVLGLDEGAVEAEINKAFRAAALKYHPDRNKDKSEDGQKEAAKQFEEALRAKEYLLGQLKNNQSHAGSSAADGQNKQNRNKQNQARNAPRNPAPTGSNEKSEPSLNLPDFQTMSAALDILSNGLGKLEPVRKTRPTWTESEKEFANYSNGFSIISSNSAAVVPHEHFTQFKYTREYENGNIGVATLYRSEADQRIRSDGANDSIKATVELAKGAGWSGVKVLTTMSKDKLDLYEAECKKHGLAFEYHPSPFVAPNNQQAPRPNQSKADSDEEYSSEQAPRISL